MLTSKKTGGPNRYAGAMDRDASHTDSGVGVIEGETGGKVDMMRPVEAYDGIRMIEARKKIPTDHPTNEI